MSSSAPIASFRLHRVLGLLEDLDERTSLDRSGHWGRGEEQAVPGLLNRVERTHHEGQRRRDHEEMARPGLEAQHDLLGLHVVIAAG